MPVTPYRYAGAILSQAASIWDPQKDNMGMLELNIDRIIPGGKEILTLSIQEFSVPGRSVNTAELPYLNGRVKYAAGPNALGNITATFRDFPRAGTRRILEQWFGLVYDEVTGLMAPMAAVKTTGHCVLFDSDGSSERSYLLEGLFPVSAPEVAVQFGGGEAMVMQIELSADRRIPQNNLLNPVQPTT